MPQSHNKYAYVQNNPLRYTDPTGEELVINGSDADALVEELSNATGYALHRCVSGDKFKGCGKQVGQVLIDRNVKKITGRHFRKVSE